MMTYDLNTPEGRKHIPEGWHYNPCQGLFQDTSAKVCDLIVEIRQLRKLKIDSVLWAVERHNRQVLIGKTPTLSAREFFELNTYIEALCDFPETLDPDESVINGDALNGLGWPQLSDALLAKVMRRDGGFV